MKPACVVTASGRAKRFGRSKLVEAAHAWELRRLEGIASRRPAKP